MPSPVLFRVMITYSSVGFYRQLLQFCRFNRFFLVPPDFGKLTMLFEIKLL